MEIIGSIAGNFLSPQGVDIEGSTLCLADTGNHQLVLYNIAAISSTAPVRLGFMGTDPTAEGFLFPRSLCFLSDTELVVADTQNGHLDRYSSTAGIWSYQGSLASFGGVSVGRIVDVIRHDTSSLIILDDVNKQVIQVDMLTGSANVLLNVATWQRPMSIRTGGGYTWIADADGHRVYRYDSTGTEMVIGSFGLEEGKLSRPLGIALDESAAVLYVAEGDVGRISSFSFDGQFIEALLLPAGVVHEIHCLQIDQSGHLWVADAGANLLYEVSRGSNGPRPVLRPSVIDFGPVGVGFRLPIGIKLENVGDADLLVQAISLAGSGFELGGSIATPQSILPGASIQFEVYFGPTDQGPSNGVLEVENAHEQGSPLRVSLYGVGVAAEPQALVLVLDRSGSMTQSAGEVSKIERVRHVVELLVSLFADRPADELALATFSSSATLDRPFGAPPNNLVSAIAGVQAIGSTSIGAGLQTASLAMQSTKILSRIIIVLSDGKENTPPLVDDFDVQAAIDSSDDRVFSVGLGLPENIDVAVLTRLASSSGGYFQLTDERYYLLPKFFVQIFADATGEQVAVDPVLTVGADEEEITLVNVARDEKRMTIVATWDNYKWQCDIGVETPDGVRVEPSEFTYVHSADGQRVVRLSTQSPGQWKVCLRGRGRMNAQPVVLTVLLDSPVRVQWKAVLIRRDAANEIAPDSGKATGRSAEVFPETLRTSTIDIVNLGDTLRIEPEFSRTSRDVQITGGTVRVDPPQWSLRRLRKRASGVNLDEGDAPLERPKGLFQLLDDSWFRWVAATLLGVAILVGVFWQSVIGSLVFFGLLAILLVSLFLKRRYQTASREYAWTLRDGRAIADIPIEGLDGVNVVTARLEAVRADGSRLQREHVICVLSE